MVFKKYGYANLIFNFDNNISFLVFKYTTYFSILPCASVAPFSLHKLFWNLKESLVAIALIQNFNSRPTPPSLGQSTQNFNSNPFPHFPTNPATLISIRSGPCYIDHHHHPTQTQSPDSWAAAVNI